MEKKVTFGLESCNFSGFSKSVEALEITSNLELKREVKMFLGQTRVDLKLEYGVITGNFYNILNGESDKYPELGERVMVRTLKGNIECILVQLFYDVCKDACCQEFRTYAISLEDVDRFSAEGYFDEKKNQLDFSRRRYAHNNVIDKGPEPSTALRPEREMSSLVEPESEVRIFLARKVEGVFQSFLGDKKFTIEGDFYEVDCDGIPFLGEEVIARTVYGDVKGVYIELKYYSCGDRCCENGGMYVVPVKDFEKFQKTKYFDDEDNMLDFTQ